MYVPRPILAAPSLLLAALLALPACAPKHAETTAAAGASASTKKHAGGEASVKPPGEAPELLPTPFTMEQLRDALPEGTRIRLRIETSGQPTVLEQWTFVRCTPTEATIASVLLGEDGAVIEDEGQGTSAWTELQAHAAFPAAHTKQSEGALDTPFGHFDTWVYTVDRPGSTGQMETHTFAFGKTLPGPPLLYTVEREGREVMRMTQIARGMGEG